MQKIRAIQFGLGTIGSEIAKLILERGMEIAGAVDIDPEKVGRDLGEVLGLGKMGVIVSSGLDGILDLDADIVVNSTVSSLERIEQDIIKVAMAKKNFISTCEELVYPYAQHPDSAARIDRIARENGVTVLGTGVNPGFVMDRLVLMVAGASKGIRKIRAERVVNSSERRLPLQKKTGAGMSLQEFEESYGKGIVRHVGLLESVKMISDGLGLEIDEIKEEVEPVIAEHDVQSRQIKAEKGKVSGIRQISQGMKNGEAIITLELKMHLGAEAYDRIEIEGEPSICLKISNGIHGDLATTAIIVNSIPGVISARPGLLTVKDMI